jgi:hypothetical protein
MALVVDAGDGPQIRRVVAKIVTKTVVPQAWWLWVEKLTARLAFRT